MKYGEDWEEQAACRNADTDLFFPIGTRVTNQRAAELMISYCGYCPVNEQCLMFALDHMSGEGAVGQHGVWAGTTPGQRRDLARQRKRGGSDALT